jgi:hypothetical protein
MLLNTLCIRNRPAVITVIKELGFDPHIVIELATSFSINIRIREVFLNFAVQLILTSDMFFSWSQSKLKDLSFHSSEL